MEVNKIYLGDCLELMPNIEDKSIDMILCDLPYGTTACSWDVVIPFEPLWKSYKRIIKDNGAIVLTGSQPFTSMLVMSNLEMFKYEWIWHKNSGTGFAVSKYQPMRYHESILVFAKSKTNYFPIKSERYSIGSKMRNKYKMNVGNENTSHHVPMKKIIKKYDSETKSPESVICIKSVNNSIGKLHSTEKPVELFEYLIRTYTNENDLVLDNCIGSGTTAIACIKSNRNYIGIEKDDKYFEIAKNRIELFKSQTKLF
jgi:site-specific DNA-methyltransferase (adenine-specific)